MALSAWTPRSFRWRVADPSPQADELARQIGVAPLVAQVLCNRGIDEPEAGRAFLDPTLNDLHDPSLLAGADQAAKRIAKAVAGGERIVIYGDYDVDGMTGVAILHACLTMVGADVHYYVPHRLEEGYGVNAKAIAKLVGRGAQLLVTVDCGITAVGPIAEAVAGGMDVIVTDHHGADEQLPAATAIVHPGVPPGSYPNGNLAGAAVAFKLAWAVAREICGNTKVDDEMRKFLLDATCLAALGTIADVVPLTGENRVIAKFGLRGLSGTSHPGLRALIDSSGLTGEQITVRDVAFALAPRLNACGRMGHARQAVELLTGEAPERCVEIAAQLAKHNTERQRVQREVAEQAEQMVRDKGMDSPDCGAIVLGSADWHGGVVGIVASRLVGKFARPAVVIAVGADGIGQGSGRSVAGLDLREALAGCAEHLLSFGGHAMAAGLKIEMARVDAFADALSALVREATGGPQEMPILDIDAETTVAALRYPVVEQLDKLAPFGQGNRPPVVAIRDCEVRTPPERMGRNGQAIRCHLGQGPAAIRAVGFGMGDLADLLAGVKQIDVAARPTLNTFRGRTNVQLVLEDVLWK